ncbi:DUF6653 family protein [Marinagarivorans cellulosilyticus]|uniref:Uncharacterized protein n=1 Tax=Marinagarivorans cellulosilyticus TaxID=2721545 RepID=A0AAN1WIR9_9GAMM|nr:DUF6653 family protein [Marinagarivorans cellulosilyticus]BCD98366.1 hypothetical protein MARGE09_P2567 [Marinagarivorans cellulosilyticus]
MDLNNAISKLFLSDDESWFKHANPWSVWSRFATLPFIVLSIWSRVWIGWYCLIPIVILAFWTWINPTLFSKPQNYNSWGSKAVLGERLFIKRKQAPIPDGHLSVIRILNVLQFLGGAVLVCGLWRLDISLTFHGVAYIYLTKMWFLDRMVWLYESSNSA